MNTRHRASSSSLFLMELILAILLFCIASTICISIFAKSHTMNKDAGKLNMAVNEAANVAESIMASESCDDMELNLKRAYENALVEGNRTVIRLDDTFTSTAKADTYEMIIEYRENGTLLLANITVLEVESGTEIYSLGLKKSYNERMVADETE